MKKYTLLHYEMIRRSAFFILTLLCPLCVFGQETDILVDKGKSWECLTEWPGMEAEAHVYAFSEDVTENGKTYSKLLKDGSFFALLRQEGDKVFMVSDDYAGGEEVLLYDFGLKVGEKFSFTGEDSENLVVINVDSIKIGDRIRRRIIFEWERYLPKDYDAQSLTVQDDNVFECWVEGIGSVYGPVSPMIPFIIGASYYRTEKCLQDGSVIFTYSDFGADPYSSILNVPFVVIHPQNEKEHQPTFDLQGRRLDGQPTKGIYIRNGKKHVIK